jgi:ankyrin repeat protein
MNFKKRVLLTFVVLLVGATVSYAQSSVNLMDGVYRFVPDNAEWGSWLVLNTNIPFIKNLIVIMPNGEVVSRGTVNISGTPAIVKWYEDEYLTNLTIVNLKEFKEYDSTIRFLRDLNNNEREIFRTYQTVFTQNLSSILTMNFAEKFATNDIAGIEKLLKEHSYQIDLQTCLNTVSYSLAWITDSENPRDDMKGGQPLNRNRNSIFQTIQLLVNSGVDLNDKNRNGVYISRNNTITFYRNIDESLNILFRAIRGNNQTNMAIIRFLLESGAIPNLSDLYYMDKQLFMAIDQGNNALVKLLIDAGCKIDVTSNCSTEDYYSRRINNSGSMSALQYATYWGEFAIVKMLVEAGAKLNYASSSTGSLSAKTAAVIAQERKETDIYNYLRSNQVASTPQSSSSQQSSTYTPPPSNSSGSSSSSSSSSSSNRTTARDVVDTINRAFESPLENGRYRMSGRTEEISFAGIAKAGNVSFKDASGTTHRGTYSIDGDRLTINVMSRSFFYTVNSKTSFSGQGESWYRVGF